MVGSLGRRACTRRGVAGAPPPCMGTAVRATGAVDGTLPSLQWKGVVAKGAKGVRCAVKRRCAAGPFRHGAAIRGQKPARRRQMAAPAGKAVCVRQRIRACEAEGTFVVTGWLRPGNLSLASYGRGQRLAGRPEHRRRGKELCVFVCVRRESCEAVRAANGLPPNGMGARQEAQRRSLQQAGGTWRCIAV